jgi:hypothetical protein
MLITETDVIDARWMLELLIGLRVRLALARPEDVGG